MTRYRNQTEPQAPGRLIRKDFNGNITVDQLWPKPAALSRQMYDEVIPDFRKRSAKGEVFNNRMTSNRTTFSATGEYQASSTSTDSSSSTFGKSDFHNWQNGSLFMALGLTCPAVTLDPGDAAAKAALNAIASVNKTEVDAGAFVGEWSQTRSLHRALGQALVKLFTESAKVKKKRATFRKVTLFDLNGQPLFNSKGRPQYKYIQEKSETSGVGNSIITKNAANLYLVGRMGLLPLLSDLEGACKILSDNKALRRTARSNETLTSTQSAVRLVDDGSLGTWAVSAQTTKVLSFRYGILYEATAAGRMAGQLGLSRPLTSAWNLVPWSFVIDWFVNVGSWLDAVQPSFASKNLCAWVSTNETLVETLSINDSKSYVKTDLRGVGSWNGQSVRTNIVKTRSPWTPVVPTFPLLGEGFNLSRSFDFASLVLQRIKTKI